MLETVRSAIVRTRRQRRRIERDHCELNTLLSHKRSTRLPARIADISRFGCSIHAEGVFTRDDRLRVLLPLLGDVHARVAWTLTGCFGCWFDVPIGEDRYAHVLAAIKTASDDWYNA